MRPGFRPCHLAAQRRSQPGQASPHQTALRERPPKTWVWLVPRKTRRCAQGGFGESLLIGQGARSTLWIWRVVRAGSTNVQEPPPDLGGATRPNNGETRQATAHRSVIDISRCANG